MNEGRGGRQHIYMSQEQLEHHGQSAMNANSTHPLRYAVTQVYRDTKGKNTPPVQGITQLGSHPPVALDVSALSRLSFIPSSVQSLLNGRHIRFRWLSVRSNE